jgi:hypothetical protein
MRSMRRAALYTFALVLCISQIPARADQASDAADNVKTAMSKATSFEMDMSGANGIQSSTVVVLPHRVHMTMQVMGNVFESFGDGATSYTRFNSGPWKAVTVSADQVHAAIAPITQSVSNKTMLPDRVIDGVTYGVYAYDTSPTDIGYFKTPAMSTSCAYDKATFLPKQCTAKIPQMTEPLVITFSKWNDPSNVVDLPKDLPPAPPPSSPAPSSAPATSPAPVAPKPQPTMT